MQLQSISSQSPNVISITQIRQDIDVLTDLLEKYPVVRVLRGQKVLFDAIDPEFEEKRRIRIKKAAEGIRKFADLMAKKHPRKPGEKSLSQFVIDERDRMRNPNYYG